MKTANQLLDAARLALRCSDYALARELGISRSQVSEWRKGKLAMPDRTVIRLAEMAGLDAAAALVAHHLENAPAETVPTWRRIQKYVGPLVLAFALTAAPQAPPVYYVKRRTQAA
jgi:transcriptional regulator with XRE-family HTH domain